MHSHHPFLQDTTLPVGSVITFCGNLEKYTPGAEPKAFTTYPELYGWLICDGTQLNTSEYPELYSVLGQLYGPETPADGSVFNLPNLCGQFLRGIGTDQGSTENRTAATGGTQNGVGSTQKDALQTHQHAYQEANGSLPSDKGTAFAALISAFTGPPVQGPGPAVNVSQSETRPPNVFVYYLIKYTYQLPRFPHHTHFPPL